MFSNIIIYICQILNSWFISLWTFFFFTAINKIWARFWIDKKGIRSNLMPPMLHLLPIFLFIYLKWNRKLEMETWFVIKISIVKYLLFQSIEVTSPPGTVIGSIHQEWSILAPKFTVRNASDDVILRIEGPFCTYSICGDVEFQVSELFSQNLILQDSSLFMWEIILKVTICCKNVSTSHLVFYSY